MESVSVNSLAFLWSRTAERLESRLSRSDFDTWIRPIKPKALANQTVDLTVPNRLFATWLSQNLMADLTASWSAVAGFAPTFRFSWEADDRQGELFGDSARTMEAARPPSVARGTRTRSGLIERYNFHNFVVGPSNQFARAAAMAVADQPGSLYNPLFLYGGVGLGKTHLANAVGQTILAAKPGAKVSFVSSDSFTNQLIDAIARNKAQEFKNRMRRLDVLIVDDVQFLAGRERTQDEFFHIFNSLYEKSRQIILTSDKFPNELDGIEERLCNRFGWGLVADLQCPDAETRGAILERKARDEGIDLPIEVATFIAGHIDSNIRDLEGALTRISAYASLNGCAITVALARELLGNPAQSSETAVGMKEIEQRVCLHFGLRDGELKARKRTRKVAEARQLAMYLMRHHAGASFPSIGEFLGGRDHSTVVHGCQAVERRRQSDPRYKNMVDSVARTIRCG